MNVTYKKKVNNILMGDLKMINEYMHTSAKFLQLMCGFNANTNKNSNAIFLIKKKEVKFIGGKLNRHYLNHILEKEIIRQ